MSSTTTWRGSVCIKPMENQDGALKTIEGLAF
jgi:hypothetical protein